MFRPCFRVFHRSSRYITQITFEAPSRSVHCSSCRPAPPPRQVPKPPKGSPAIAGKYEILEESKAEVIENTADELPYDRYPVVADEFDGVSLTRGETGVFDIEDLVSLLQRENAGEIFVATVPREINYVDYMCVVSGKSRRHMIALAEFVRRVYKKKCRQSDIIPRIEGKGSEEWMALDLGNIALHIFSKKTRKVYDLETLWAVGPEYDEHMNRRDDHIIDMLENYTTYLKDLKPKE